jgi:mannitol-1-phosphate 5-dehydrogenase
VERVGKDPIRKLSKNDRMIGAGLQCQKYGIKPVYISLGIAAGFLFDAEEDVLASKVKEYILINGIEAAITEFCGLDDSNSMFEMIVKFYNLLNSKSGFNEILRMAEKIKR